MKKYVFMLGIIMMSLLVLSIKPSYGMEVINTKEVNVYSTDFLSYVKENNLHNIKRICVEEYCDTLRGSSISKSFERFMKNYKEYLIDKVGEEQAIASYVKGFVITKIETLE